MNIKEITKTEESTFDEQIDCYISTEEELQQNYEEMTKEVLKDNIDMLVCKKADEISEKEEKENNTKSKEAKGTICNKDEIKKTLSDKLMGFADSASKFGFTNYAIFFLIFAVTKECGSNIGAIYSELKGTKEGLEELSKICEETANEICNFDNLEARNVKMLKQYADDPIKYNYESEKLERLYKEEIVTFKDTRLEKMKHQIEQLSSNISKGDNEKAERIKKVLMKEANSLISKKLIEKGYDIASESAIYEINGKTKEVEKDTFVVVETEQTYNTRIKQMEDKGLLHDNSLEEEELTRNQYQ